jgi:predicted amidohydrolase
MTADDYLTASAFFTKVSSYFAEVDRRRTRGRPALMVFPEDFATFLLLEGQGHLLQHARTLDEAFRAIAMKEFPHLLQAMFRHRTLRTRAAFFTYGAPRVWRIWHQTMATLAKRYAVTVVAGTALLPESRLSYDSDRYVPQNGRVYNFSFTVNPRGQVISVTRKVNLVPTQEDVLQLTSGPLDAALRWVVLPDTPVKLATAICYDAFVRPHTAREPHFVNVLDRLDRAGVQLVAQPSANPWRWEELWPFDAPHQRPPRSRRQQWVEEGSYAALKQCQSIEVVINPQLIMEFLDLHFDGQSAILAREGQMVKTLAESAYSRGPEANEVLYAAWRMPANGSGESRI